MHAKITLSLIHDNFLKVLPAAWRKSFSGLLFYDLVPLVILIAYELISNMTFNYKNDEYNIVYIIYYIYLHIVYNVLMMYILTCLYIDKIIDSKSHQIA